MNATHVEVDARQAGWHAAVALDPDSVYIIFPSGSDKYTYNNGASHTDFHGRGEMTGAELGIPKKRIRLGGLVALVWHNQPAGKPKPQIFDFPPGRYLEYVRTGSQGGSLQFVIADKAGTYADNSGTCGVDVIGVRRTA